MFAKDLFYLSLTIILYIIFFDLSIEFSKILKFLYGAE